MRRHGLERYLLLLGVAVFVFMLGLPVGFGQGAGGFPEAHQDFLGGASYAALFGHDTEISDAAATALGAATVLGGPGGGSPDPQKHKGGGGPTVGPNVRVNAQQANPPGLLGRSETTITSDDDEGENLVAGWNFADGFLRPPFGNTLPGTPGLSGFGFSLNGGATWTDGQAPPLLGTHIVTRGDPWLDSDGRGGGTVFYANLAVDDRLPGGQATLGISVHRGHFRRRTFSWDDVTLLQAPNYPHDFYDKEAIAVTRERRPKGYVSLSNFIETCGQDANGFGQIEVWRTTNGGNSWQGPVIVSPDITFILDPKDPNCGNFGVEQQGSVPAIGPRGEVYIAWQRGPTFPGLPVGSHTTDVEIMVARSLDGGQTFDAPVQVAMINAIHDNPAVGYNRSTMIDAPRIAVASKGRHHGRIYVVFTSSVSPVGPASQITCPPGITPPCFAQSLVSTQTYISFSDDRGVHWSVPKALGSAVPATGLKRFWPVVTIRGGRDVDVVYYQSQEVSQPGLCNVAIGGGRRRVGAAHSLVDTILVFSTDGGETFSAPVRVSSVTSDWCTTVSNIRPNFGDYIGSVSVSDTTFPVWADGRGTGLLNGNPVHVPDTFAAPVFFGH